MFDIDRWQEIWGTIRRHKLRTALTAFGVFWGIFMLIVLFGAGKGLENGVVSQFDIAKNTVFVWSQRTSKEYAGLKPGRFIKFTNDDVAAIKGNIDEINVVAPRNVLEGGFTISYGTKNASFQVYGEYPDYTKVRPILITEGRFVNDNDISEQRKVAIIGTRVQEVLFGDKNPMGEYIKIKGVNFKVVGLFKSRSKGEDAREDSETIFLPSTSMQYSFNMVNRVHFFALTPKDGIPAEVIETKVKKLLAQRHMVAPDDIRAIGSFNIEKEFQMIQGLFAGIRGFSWLVSVGTILAGVIGVGNIMLIVVKERTKEIGIRKALGATPWSVVSLIIQEAIVITSFAGYIGLLAGVGLVEGINYLLKVFDAESSFFANPEISLSVALSATLMLVVTGTLAGVIPAMKAAAVNPVEALRDE